MKHLRSCVLALPAAALLAASVAVPRGNAAVVPGVTVATAPSGDDVAAPALLPAELAAEATPLAAVDAALVGAGPEPRAELALEDPHLDPALGRYVATLGEGRAILTLDPRLQARLERTLATYLVPWGATVLLEPATGRILALAEHSRAEPSRRDVARAAMAPAASIFKIVTAAALLEQGVGPDDEVCYHGGVRRLSPRLLRDDPRRDRRCASLSSAFGHSTNVVFAKLADRDLAPEILRTTAQRFLFNVPIAFAQPLETSTAVVPDDPFDAANTAAGFGVVKLTPLHAALLAAIVANRGMFVPPVLVDEVEGVPLPGHSLPWRVVDQAVAERLGGMMRETVAEGTARRAFRGAAPSLRGVQVAGKTGSLAEASPYRDYSWFVGYAPADNPEVAVATMIVNDRVWHARATTVAKEALEAYFAARAAGGGAVRTAAVR
jgi:cell division protein FtsI/penicillin-binding protein 2